MTEPLLVLRDQTWRLEEGRHVHPVTAILEWRVNNTNVHSKFTLISLFSKIHSLKS